MTSADRMNFSNITLSGPLAAEYDLSDFNIWYLEILPKVTYVLFTSWEPKPFFYQSSR